ncbi:Wzz/FepE/Etk N-terminal domain-containing protein [Pseudomonas putida]|uniref:Wzz/FepE/Etk N-terminal domain-containing protein n=1 Tax=Pseudomonas putida TaxID=303 RepID=UPI000952C252|nr:Wzz/FepE/Etk N-terminal domain-containing protein [Pseudomonas putida]
MSGYFEVPDRSSGDELDFWALFQSLWRQKLIVGGFVLVAGACSVGYAMLSTPIFQAHSILKPAPINELDALNRSEVYTLPPAAALARIASSLGSYEMRLSFFRDNQQLFSPYIIPNQSIEQSFDAFNRSVIALDALDVGKDAADFARAVNLTLDYPRGVDGAFILNKFVDYVIDVERKHISADVSKLIKNRLAEIQGKIDAARANYQMDKEARIAALTEADDVKRARLQDELSALRMQLKLLRADRVAVLSEAISVARSLGIRKPATQSSLAEEAMPGSGSVIKTEVNSQQAPLYFMGTDALEAELATLRARKSDDFVTARTSEIAKELQMLQVNREVEGLKARLNEDLFLDNVQPLHAEAARLQSLSTDFSQVQLVSIDQRALPSESPVKPRRALIVLAGLITGLGLGLLVAFARFQVQYMRIRSLRSAPPRVLEAQDPLLRPAETVRIE